MRIEIVFFCHFTSKAKRFQSDFQTRVQYICNEISNRIRINSPSIIKKELTGRSGSVMKYLLILLCYLTHGFRFTIQHFLLLFTPILTVHCNTVYGFTAFFLLLQTFPFFVDLSSDCPYSSFSLSCRFQSLQSLWFYSSYSSFSISCTFFSLSCSSHNHSLSLPLLFHLFFFQPLLSALPSTSPASPSIFLLVSSPPLLLVRIFLSPLLLPQPLLLLAFPVSPVFPSTPPASLSCSSFNLSCFSNSFLLVSQPLLLLLLIHPHKWFF